MRVPPVCSTNMNYQPEINDELITYLEDLSYLKLSDDEKKRMKTDLKEILKKMSVLGEIDLTNVPTRSHPYDNKNAFREDIPEKSFDRELILKNAPKKDDETFIVPITV